MRLCNFFDSSIVMLIALMIYLLSDYLPLSEQFHVLHLACFFPIYWQRRMCFYISALLTKLNWSLECVVQACLGDSCLFKLLGTTSLAKQCKNYVLGWVTDYCWVGWCRGERITLYAYSVISELGSGDWVGGIFRSHTWQHAEQL